MEITIAEQTQGFLFACLLGVALSCLYDLFRIARKLVVHGKTAVMVEDVVYWTVCGVVSFFYLLCFTNGQVRFFVLFGELLGGVIHHYTLGALVMRMIEQILKLIRKICRFVYRIFLRPIHTVLKFIAKKLQSCLKFLRCKSRILSKKRKYALKKEQSMLYNKKGRRQKHSGQRMGNANGGQSKKKKKSKNQKKKAH